MADVKELVQNILEKNAVSAKTQFTNILEQKIAAIIEDVYPLVSRNMFSEDEELDEELGEELEEGLKLLKVHTNGPHSAKVYKDSEWGEHRVKYFKDGKHLSKADSHHDDAEDAHGTAIAELNRMNEGVDLAEKAKFDDDDGDEVAEKKARKDKERARSNARLAKKKEIEEETDLQEKIPGAEFAPEDLVDMHIQRQKHMDKIQNSLYSGRSAASMLDSVSKAKKLEAGINSHPQTIEFHAKHGVDQEHPAKRIARGTAHLHEKEMNLAEKAKFDDDDGDEVAEKKARKDKERARDADRNSKKKEVSENILSRILTNLSEKAKFDDDDDDDYKEKSEKKKKDLARSKAREAKKQDPED